MERRQVLRASSATLRVLLVLASVTYPAAADDWPSFLGPHRDGRSSETGILLDWKEGGPPLVWQREVGEGYATPVVAGGRLFHVDRVGDRARLSALNATTGAALWQVETPVEYEDYYGYSNGPRASPVVDPESERVYTHGVDGRLQCRRTEDGALLWEVDTERDFGFVQNFFGVASAPLIDGELLIVPIGGSPPGSPPIHSGRVQGNGSGVVAFDQRTGKVRWRSSDQLASYASPVVRTVRGRRLGFHFARGGLLAFDPATGAERAFHPWRAPRLESVNAATPVVVGDEVLITESYGPGATLLRVTGAGDGFEVVWKDGARPKLAAHWATPVVHDGFLYASSGEKSGSAELVCIDWKTGAVRWSQPGLRRATLLYVDRHLVVLTEYGQLLLVRATPERFEAVATSDLKGPDGRPLVPHPAWGAPILANGLLYLKGEGKLAALRLIP
jgi:outer membrane protein assembly factor BamB